MPSRPARGSRAESSRGEHKASRRSSGYSRIFPTHAQGGPSNIAGSGYELDCALLKALDVIEVVLDDPLLDASIQPQGRIGDAEVLTAWDYISDRVEAVEVKSNATTADIREWIGRALAAWQADRTKLFRLVYGSSSSPLIRSISRLVDLAQEARDDDELAHLATSDRLSADLAALELPIERLAFLQRLELKHHDPQSVEQTLASRAAAIFDAKATLTLPVLRDLLRRAASHRMAVSAHDLISSLKAADFVPRERQCKRELRQGDVRRSTVFLLQHCGWAIPVALLADLHKMDRETLLTELAPLLSRGILREELDAFAANPAFPKIRPTNGCTLTEALLSHALSATERREQWAISERGLRLTAELCQRLGGANATVVATAFGILDKQLKNVGDIDLVARTAEACVAAARSIGHGTAEARRGEAQALICGVAWSLQRRGRLHAAREAAELSRNIGEAIGYARNTAFCDKCIGRLLRLEAAQETGARRRQLLAESVDYLRRAIQSFEKLEDAKPGEREAEMGACYSLLGRTYLSQNDRAAAASAIAKAKPLVLETRSKDILDLWILRGEFYAHGGDLTAARDALDEALAIDTASGFEATEMRARAFEQRAAVQETVRQAAQDFAEAANLYRHLHDDDAAAGAELRRLDKLGQIPAGLSDLTRGLSNIVALESVRLVDEHRRRAGAGAVARRAVLSSNVLREFVDIARRTTAIENSGAARATPRAPVATTLHAKHQKSRAEDIAAEARKTARPKASSATPQQKGRRSSGAAVPVDLVVRRLVPNARNFSEAASQLARMLVINVTEPPVALDAVAKQLGATKIEAASLCGSGELHGIIGDFTVKYAKQDSPQRARFTVAHELAHILFDTASPEPVRRDKALERMCDLVASELLLPRHLLGPREAALPVLAASIVGVAHRFDVSIQASALRLHQLNPQFVAYWVEDRKVSWSVGAALRGPIARLAPDISRATKLVVDETRCEEEVYFESPDRSGMWTLDVMRFKRGVLITLSPSKRK